jgi:hypothetical protein
MGVEAAPLAFKISDAERINASGSRTKGSQATELDGLFAAP